MRGLADLSIAHRLYTAFVFSILAVSLCIVVLSFLLILLCHKLCSMIFLTLSRGIDERS
jgi:hypothetical protein